MDSGVLLSDAALMREIGERVAAHRLGRNMTQAELASKAGVGVSTLKRLEGGTKSSQLTNFLRVCRALGLTENWDAFIPEVPPSPMAQLKRQGRQRQRASGSRVEESSVPGKWTWGEEAK